MHVYASNIYCTMPKSFIMKRFSTNNKGLTCLCEEESNVIKILPLTLDGQSVAEKKVNLLKPRKGRWTKTEQLAFINGIFVIQIIGFIKHGRNWNELKTYVPSRNVIQLRTHAQKLLVKIKHQAPKDQDPMEYLKSRPAIQFISFRKDNNTQNYEDSHAEDHPNSDKEISNKNSPVNDHIAEKDINLRDERKEDISSDKVPGKVSECVSHDADRSKLSQEPAKEVKCEDGGNKAMEFHDWNAEEELNKQPVNHGSMEFMQEDNGDKNESDASPHIRNPSEIRLDKTAISPNAMAPWNTVYAICPQMYQLPRTGGPIIAKKSIDGKLYPTQMIYSVVPYSNIYLMSGTLNNFMYL